MRRAAMPLPPEEIWLGEPWEDAPPARRREARPAGSRAGAVPVPVASEPRTRFERTAPPEPSTRFERMAPPEPRTRFERTAPPERRTVTIRGRGAERDLTWTGGRPPRPTRPVHERPGFKPDRAAMWAVLLGLLLVLIAATSSHAAVRAQSTAAARARDGAAPAARVVAHPAAAPVRAQAAVRHRD